LTSEPINRFEFFLRNVSSCIPLINIVLFTIMYTDEHITFFTQLTLTCTIIQIPLRICVNPGKVQGHIEHIWIQQFHSRTFACSNTAFYPNYVDNKELLNSLLIITTFPNLSIIKSDSELVNLLQLKFQQFLFREYIKPHTYS